MMRGLVALVVFASAFFASSAAIALAAKPLPAPLVTGLKNPTGVCIGGDKRVYVTVAGEMDKDGDGAVLVINDKGEAVPFAEGLDDPSAIAKYQDFLFVADKQKIVRVNKKGEAELWCPASAFPFTPKAFRDLTVNPENGSLYVYPIDVTDRNAHRGIFRVSPQRNVESVRHDGTGDGRPQNLLLDGGTHLLITYWPTNELRPFNLATGSTTEGSGDIVKEGPGTRQPWDNLGPMAWDKFGRLFVGRNSFVDEKLTAKILVVPRPGEKAVQMVDGLNSITGLSLDATNRELLAVDQKAGSLYSFPVNIPGWEVDDAPLPIETTSAFPDLKFAGWKSAEETGNAVPLRPIVLTHAGDGNHRKFVATEQGVIHVFANDDNAKETKIFLDIQKQVVYDDKQNEEGLLGLAFHPKYKENGEFFVFYTTTAQKKTNVLSRFHVSKDDPDKADPASEEIILKIEDRPYWNHDGGTICFGPDGYLYLCSGDGGAANDPYENAQNLKSLLGKVLRIDVDHKDKDKNYAIPKDNPFVGGAADMASVRGRSKDARGEIWAYGLRNIWRMAFDRETKRLWAGDVGQNLFEEIDLIEKGGNYGWNLREGMHPFGARGVGFLKNPSGLPRRALIDPIWEYHHDIGKCIIGGCVYRGKKLPDLAGKYLYGDYVTGKLWALQYDETKKRVTANHPLRDHGVQVMSFGEDEEGEVYILAASNTGQGIFRLTRATDK